MASTITKRALVEHLAQRLNRDPAMVRDVVQLLMDTISEHLVNGNRIELRNFGVFSIRRRKPRLGRNPHKPDETVQIPATPVPVFKAGKILKHRVKNQSI